MKVRVTLTIVKEFEVDSQLYPEGYTNAQILAAESKNGYDYPEVFYDHADGMEVHVEEVKE